ncbi:hypothetical protein CLV98_1182 [Dyadobacter jejuensis]|uniref:DUF5675 domain-containing protein n=1 Tax=Dyadobacter jejuensis TaxID=1082580 RepID=A0A316ABK6_9BACT|nr:DUF5675 family protein [Dyadobacter jejuensis]PWJ54244.1 hypothetical protein CLV98_1182 [Dyadobacter jejuensis]
MELVLTRRWKATRSTLGTLKVDGEPHQFILEDLDRSLDASWPLEKIKETKVYGQTAIPTGRYQVVITYSARFKRQLPILIGVPGYSGIRIHPGNRHNNTEGCLLPGTHYGREDGQYIVMQSRIASDRLQNRIAAALARGEQVWVTVERQY